MILHKKEPVLKNRLNDDHLRREIGLFSATILVVANMIGTGIFTTSGFIIAEIGNPQAMLLCWLVGGLFALCGALCYGELGAAFPRAGGEYVFLKESFGEGIGFLSGWISLIVGFSAPIAAASIAFASYFLNLFSLQPGSLATLSLFGTHIFTVSLHGLVAIGTVSTFSVIHCYGLLLGSRVQNVLTLFKIGLIVVFIGAGFLLGNGVTGNLYEPLNISVLFQDKFAVSLVFISFAYSGWNAAVYLGAEIKKPGRNIPLALFVGTSFVICLYLLLNILYVYSLPVDEMKGVLEVGAKSASSLFGPHIGKYFCGAIAMGLLSVISAMIMAGPRVYYAMSKDNIFFGLFGRVSKVRGTPVYSILLQWCIAIFMIITASFDALLLYIGFTLSFCAMLTVVGLMLLRTKQPALFSDYRTFAYPVTPLLFILGNIWIIYFSIKSKPIASLFGLGTICLGFVVYFFFHRRKQIHERLFQMEGVRKDI